MNDTDWLAKRFEESRNHLTAVAYRMLGSAGEAEDAVQETWIRLSRSKAESIDNLSGWLTTVVARVCLDMLRSRKLRREEPLSGEAREEAPAETAKKPEADFAMADSVGQALILVLDLLTPSERIAFVLHDLFDLSFKEIAPIIDRSEAATRQLASRARRRVRGNSAPQEDSGHRRALVSAFLSASRNGDFEALIRLLHPDVTLRADETAIKISAANKSRGAPQFKREIRGADGVADTFNGKAKAAQLALVNGSAGATWAPGGKPLVAFCFSIEGGKISAIEIVMDRDRLADFDIEIVDMEVPAHS